MFSWILYIRSADLKSDDWKVKGMVRSSSSLRCLNAHVYKRKTSPQTTCEDASTCGNVSMKVLSSMIAGSLGVMLWFITLVYTAILQSSLHNRMKAFLEKMWPNNPSVMTFRGRKWSMQHFSMMRQVKRLLQSNDDNNLDYTPQPLPSILSLFYLKSHFYSITLDSQYFALLDRCIKWNARALCIPRADNRVLKKM